MSVSKSQHWTCDSPGCSEHGSGPTLPNDWRYINLFAPHNTPYQPNPAEMHLLLCPNCAARTRAYYKKESTQ